MQADLTAEFRAYEPGALASIAAMQTWYSKQSVLGASIGLASIDGGFDWVYLDDGTTAYFHISGQIEPFPDPQTHQAAIGVNPVLATQQPTGPQPTATAVTSYKWSRWRVSP